MNEESNFRMEIYASSSEEEDTEALERALVDGYNPNYDIDHSGATALHRFAENGWLKSLRILLNHSITRTDIVDEKRRTPLHYAASAPEELFEQSLEVTSLLLDHGLDIDAVCNATDLDLPWCLRASTIALPTALFMAINKENVGLAALLLERGANIDIRNVDGFTPLMLLMEISGYKVSAELVSLLLFYNVDVNFSFNTHPLFTAAECGNEIICGLLVDYFEGFDCLDCAEECSCLSTEKLCYKTVRFLLKANFHVDTIINIVDKVNLQLTTHELIYLLVESGQLENQKLFNYLYDKLKLRDIEMEDCQLVDVARFFIYSKFNKTDFMSAVKKLFDVELDIGWDLHIMSRAYLKLFRSAKPRLNLQSEDMETILYQMFLVHHEICFRDLSDIFKGCLISDGCGVTTGFTDDFEIFLKSGIRVLEGFRPIDFISPFSRLHFIFGQILFPYIQQVAEPPRKVKSLLVLSRDVIRRNLQPGSPKQEHLFRYYDGVQRLDLPQMVKDIIVLKRHANVIEDDRA